jgi:hypothetical protein
MEKESPRLVEAGMRSFLKATLKECHCFKSRHFSTVYNIGLAVFFVILCISILYFMYKGRLTPEEKEIKERQKKQYIMTKLMQLSDHKRRNNEKMITNLPDWSNNPEAVLLQKNF